MKFIICFWVLAGIFTLTSCNLTQQYINKSERKYDKWGRISWMENTDSASVYWRKIGDEGPILLLIHGFGPVPQIQWQDLVQELQGDFTIYVPDLIYFGKSTSASTMYDPRFLARQIMQSFQIQEDKNFSIAGVSYGGLISSLIADEHSERVENLILIDALSKYMEKDYADSLAEAMGHQSISKLLVPENGKELKHLFKLTFYKPPKYPACLLNRPARQLYGDQRSQKQNLMAFLNNNEHIIKNWTFNFDGPVTIIWGREDVLIPVENAYLIQDQYKNSSIEIIDQAAHAVNMENAKEVAEIIRNLK